ncbi:MAG: tRNA dihydrouridine synthase DusB [Gammaproteobacteria bacterium]|nr:tRNA dihydrouridine synthase DusB [Pseudomonadales bacterium]MCP5349214.1 tRNA dihydrouridine synthase DusB [Pseudomonadales bacterium]
MKPIQLGDFVIANPLLLAPMAGVSDSPFREICSANGAGLTVAEMLTSDSERWGSEKNRLRQVKPDISGPQVVQIAGSDPGLMSEAAILNVAMGADVIDINMGCPAKKVLRKAAGSALLKDPALVERILRAVVAAVDVPVTLKIRTGWCPESRNGVEIARLAEQTGIRLLTVHGRTRACRFRGQAEYDTIAHIKQSVSIPVIANGDITSPEKARLVLSNTGADGLMIGRGAQGQPWIFRAISHYLKTGRLLPRPDSDSVSDIIVSHLEKIFALYGEHKGVLFARKHVNWYTGQLAAHQPEASPCAREFWRQFSGQQTPSGQLSALRDYFTGLTAFDTLTDNNNKGIAA